MAQQLIATVPGVGPTDLVSPPGTRYCTRTWYSTGIIQYGTVPVPFNKDLVLAVIIFDIYIWGNMPYVYCIAYFPHTLSTTAVFCYVLCSM